jgi:hypothetical protein
VETVEVVGTLGGVEQEAWQVRVDGRPARDALDEIAARCLEARRRGLTIGLRGETAACVAAMLGVSVEVLGQPEESEQAGVEEVVMPDDPIA